MSVLKTFIQDPDDVVDYTIDWSSFLGTDTIATSVWTLTTGLTAGAPPSTNTTTTATVWLSAGVAGANVTVKNKITTAGGRIREESIRVLVRAN